jgi:hypothetical protein
MPATGPSPTSHNLQLTIAGGFLQAPPISSPWGSIFGFAGQTAPLSRSLHLGPPGPSTPVYLAPNRSPPAPGGAFHPVPSISSPWGSIFGFAGQTAPLSRSLHPGPAGPSTPVYLAPYMPPPAPAGAFRPVPSIYGFAGQTAPLSRSLHPGPPGPSTPVYLAPHMSPPAPAGGFHPVPSISSPWGSIFDFAGQTAPLSASLHPGPPGPSTPVCLAPHMSPPAPAGGFRPVPSISSPWGSIYGFAGQTASPRVNCILAFPGPNPGLPHISYVPTSASWWFPHRPTDVESMRLDIRFCRPNRPPSR